jgi:nitroreductase
LRAGRLSVYTVGQRSRNPDHAPLEVPMEFFEVVAKRYSHKTAYDRATAVPAGDLEKIVTAGMLAPSASNRQSPEFVIVTDPALLDKIGAISDHVVLKTAPALIAILTKPKVRQVLDIQTEFLLMDVAAAADQMLLAATALGYCCGWLDGPFTKDEIRKPVEALLGVPEDSFLHMVVPVGYAGEPGTHRPKKPFAQRASWNKYAVER